MDFEIFVTPGLGDNTYLIRSEGDAALIDPQRDSWRFSAAAAAKGISIRYVLETHVHNDYVSGARAARASTGAEIAGPAKAGYGFEHRPLREGDELCVGSLRLIAVETPGHTPEHLAYLVYEGAAAKPVAIFSGGSLIVGSAGRTDLLGEAQTQELTRAQFHTLRRIGQFDDELLLLPTHGAGSFCAATTPALRRTSTLGQERASNPALLVEDEDAFVHQQLEGLVDFPAYYREMAPINRAGPLVLRSAPPLTDLSPAGVDQLQRDGAWIVDARDRVDFAGAHIPGAVNIELNNTFASYVGWIVPFASRVVLVLPDESTGDEVSTQLLRIGYDNLAGHLSGGIDAWTAAGLPISSYPVAEIDDVCRACLAGQPMEILDVRQRHEWDQGHIPEKSTHLFIGDLLQHIDELPRDVEMWTICASGYRAAMAASLLDRAGIPVRLVSRGGVPEWAAHCYPQASTASARDSRQL